MGRLVYQRLVEVRKLNSEQTAVKANSEWWKLLGNQHKQKASKTLLQLFSSLKEIATSDKECELCG